MDLLLGPDGRRYRRNCANEREKQLRRGRASPAANDVFVGWYWRSKRLHNLWLCAFFVLAVRRGGGLTCLQSALQ